MATFKVGDVVATVIEMTNNEGEVLANGTIGQVVEDSSTYTTWVLFPEIGKVVLMSYQLEIARKPQAATAQPGTEVNAGKAWGENLRAIEAGLIIATSYTKNTAYAHTVEHANEALPVVAADLAALRSQVAALTSERDAMRAAVKPFADLWTALFDGHRYPINTPLDTVFYAFNNTEITLNDLEQVYLKSIEAQS